MKKKTPYISYILIALLVVTQVYLISKINNLESQITNTNNTINNINNNLSERINLVYSNVDEQLKEKASIIHDASFSFGEFDTDTITVPVNFTVSPKQVTDSMKVYLKLNDETIQLEKEDNSYKGTKIFNISENEINPDIIIEDNGIKTITEDDGLRIYNLVDEFIPRLYSMGPSNSSITTRPNSDVIEYQQARELFIDGNYEDFKKIQYVTYIDNKKVDEFKINLSKFNIGEPVFISDKTFKLEKGQILTNYVIALDNLGFTHYYPIDYYKAGSDLQREPYHDIVRITDKNGEIIYDSTENGEYEEKYGYEVEVVYP